MAGVVRRIEVLAESERSWEDAAEQALEKLGRQLLHGIDSIRVEEVRSDEGHEELCRYRVDLTVSFSRSRRAMGRSEAHGASRSAAS